jgi:hypothetical protein
VVNIEFVPRPLNLELRGRRNFQMNNNPTSGVGPRKTRRRRPVVESESCNFPPIRYIIYVTAACILVWKLNEILKR